MLYPIDLDPVVPLFGPETASVTFESRMGSTRKAIAQPATPVLATAEQVKARFQEEGKTFTEWAREHGFKRLTVYQVLNGVIKGKYGEGHDIAVKLGMKAAPDSQKPTT